MTILAGLNVLTAIQDKHFDVHNSDFPNKPDNFSCMCIPFLI